MVIIILPPSGWEKPKLWGCRGATWKCDWLGASKTLHTKTFALVHFSVVNYAHRSQNVWNSNSQAQRQKTSCWLIPGILSFCKRVFSCGANGTGFPGQEPWNVPRRASPCSVLASVSIPKVCHKCKQAGGASGAGRFWFTIVKTGWVYCVCTKAWRKQKHSRGQEGEGSVRGGCCSWAPMPVKMEYPTT